MSREEMEALSTGELPVAQVYQAYCRVLRQRGWMDYDDQMVYAAQILRRHGGDSGLLSGKIHPSLCG